MFSYSCQIRYVAYEKQSHNILILLSKKKIDREIEKYQQLCAEGISIALTEHWKAARSREQMGYGSRRI